MNFIYFVFPLLFIVLIAGLLLRNRARIRKPSVTHSRAWRDQSAPAHPFSDTVLVSENGAAIPELPDNSAAARGDVGSDLGDTGSATTP